MVALIKYLKILLLSCIVLLVMSTCASRSESVWFKTSDAVYLWIPASDTINSYFWEGNSIDNIPNGDGTLTIIDKNGQRTNTKVNMFFGTTSMEDVKSMNDGSRYIGIVIEDKMEGFGILIKNKELYIGTFCNSKPNGFLKYYKNGHIYYEGYWKDGIFHGEGTLYKEDGSIKTGEWIEGRLSQTVVDVHLPEGHYEGYVRDGQPDGIGRMSYADISSYLGYWKEGLWQGEGLYTIGNDSIYGQWEKNTICGEIKYRTADFYFDGTAIDNSPIGEGILVQSDGSHYSGYWLDGKRHGTGDMIFPNGDTYFGDWADNMFEGYGVYHYSADSAVYQGEWQKGLQHGDGEYRCPNFSYTGQWDQGWIDGDGTLIFSNGDQYEGTFHENLIDGIGCYTFANENRYEGEFVKGKMNGLGIFQFKNGDRFEGEFLDGKIYGDGTMYLASEEGIVSITGFWPKDGSYPQEASMLFPNGDLYEGPLVNGQPTPDGTWISGEERQKKLDKVNASPLHKANELYKKHRETINMSLLEASAFVTAVEIACASTVVGAPIAGLLHIINIGINVLDASMAIASAGIDVMENNQLGEDNTEAIQNLTTEIAMNVAFVLVPKVAKAGAKPLKSGLKYVTRSAVIKQIIKEGKNIARQSAFRFVKGKTIGKQIRLSIAKGGRKIEKTLVRSKVTQKSMIFMGRILTQLKHQTIPYSSYLQKIAKNPNLKKNLKLSAEGSSKNLGDNMRLFGTDKWVKKSEQIRRYLGMTKRQVEPHHIVPSNPTTENGKKAREIWIRFFNSVDHPCNGIWLGRGNKEIGYKALAKGSNHVSNSPKYEEAVAKKIINTYQAALKKGDSPEVIQQKLAETVDEIKKQLYKGELAIGTNSHAVHTAASIFGEGTKARIIADKIEKIFYK